MTPTDPQFALSIAETRFLICDIEATGSDPNRHRIFEIALVELHRENVAVKFAQLFNPHQHIPRPISAVTGVFDYHVFTAPSLPEHLGTIHHLLNQPNTVFVGHNVQFDWKFITAAFRKFDYPVPTLPRLCTYRLARRLLTRNKKFNVEALAQYFGITATHFHRARADALTTAHILRHLIDLARERYDIESLDELLRLQYRPLKTFRVSKSKKERLQPILEQLPQLPGVYEFYDQHQSILYVGKAKNLRDRIQSYFTQTRLPAKIGEMLSKLETIRWTTTETELAALLLENRKIKALQPPYNTLSKRYHRYVYLKLHTEQQFPYLECVTTILDDGAEYYGPFRSRRTAENLKLLLERYFPIRRCNGNLTAPSGPRACLDFYLNRCVAPCIHPDLAAHDRIVQQLRATLSGKTQALFELFRRIVEYHSQQRNYEAAQATLEQLREVQRIFSETFNGSTAIHDRNFIIVQPSPHHRNKAELYCIRHGLVAYQRLIGKRFPAKELAQKLEQIYGLEHTLLPPQQSLARLSEEIRIVTYWLHSLNPPVVLPITPPLQIDSLLTQLQQHVYATLHSAAPFSPSSP